MPDNNYALLMIGIQIDSAIVREKEAQAFAWVREKTSGRIIWLKIKNKPERFCKHITVRTNDDDDERGGD